MQFEPNSPIARNELTYIKQLRERGLRGGGPVQLQTTKPSELTCCKCGRTLSGLAGAQVQNVGGLLRYTCKDCAAEASRPWWDFRRRR